MISREQIERLRKDFYSMPGILEIISEVERLQRELKECRQKALLEAVSTIDEMQVDSEEDHTSIRNRLAAMAEASQ